MGKCTGKKYREEVHHVVAGYGQDLRGGQ
jgi:hypothetical protein